MNAKKVIQAIKKCSRFLIVSHVDLEGDALGSELALASLLNKLGKTAYIVTSDKKLVDNYKFLYGGKKIYRRLDSDKFEAVFIIDCANRERIGKISNLIGRKKLIINIDHHRDNQKFGQVNWIDPQASSTGEMIYRLFELTRTKLGKQDALTIYTAILTDTGSFRHANTTSRVFQICSRLLEFGVEPVKVYTKIYENNSAQDIALAAQIISKISFAANNRIAWLAINQSSLKQIQGKHEVFDKLLDFARSIGTVKVVLIFSQVNKGLIKLNLRSKSPVDVQKVARAFGGGGHKFASGCKFKGTLKQAKQALLKRVKQALKHP